MSPTPRVDTLLAAAPNVTAWMEVVPAERFTKLVGLARDLETENNYLVGKCVLFCALGSVIGFVIGYVAALH